jgi:hypothetical protein
MKRFLQLSIALALALAVVSCGGSSTLDDTEASVYLTIEVEQYSPDIDICVQPEDVSIESMTITSSLKDPQGTSSSQQDVTLQRWVVRPYRTDGGSETSPEWQHDLTVFVPADGTADLENYRVYPLEYLSEVPLAYLLPENGGSDPETGNTNIRQSLELTIYGETVSGKRVATTPIPIAFNFFCNGQ